MSVNGNVVDFIDYRNRSAIEGMAKGTDDEDLIALADALLTMYNHGILKVTYDENDEPLFSLMDNLTEEQWEYAREQFLESMEVY